MRTVLTIAAVALLAPLSAPAQAKQPTTQASASKTEKMSTKKGTKATHKREEADESTARHARKIGTGENVDNSHPQVFGDDQGSSKPKPKP